MKRMKALLGVVLVIAMVLSLSLTAFAADIIVAEPADGTYNIYKVFDAKKDSTNNNEFVYELKNDALAAAILDSNTGFKDLILTKTADGTTNTPATYTVKPTATFSAAEFAKWLKDPSANPAVDRTSMLEAVTVHRTTNGNLDVDINGDPVEYADLTKAEVEAGVAVNENGYYFITYDNTPYALTTVMDEDVQIQNKSDMPFDKEVYQQGTTTDIDGQSVQGGDVLTYKIKGKVPNTEGNTQYLYKVWDLLGKGLKLAPDSIVVKIDNTPVPVTTILDSVNPQTAPIDSTPKDSLWVNDSDPANYTETKPSFVLVLDIGKQNADGTQYYTAGKDIEITYNVRVTTDLGVLVNTAHLVSNDYIKDAQTLNYTSEITVDKYETGNASQKLSGAKFVLSDGVAVDNNGNRTYTENYYYIDNTTNDVSWLPLYADGADNDIADKLSITVPNTETNKAAYVFSQLATAADANESVIKVTKTDGSANFTGLKDGTYYLHEVAAPDGYVQLSTPVTVVVDGSKALDPQNTVENNPNATTANQNVQLQNVSHVANTPGSVLPSTGGRGTTMLYMAGLGMMLAAGAFLIFRRRAEAGK